MGVNLRERRTVTPFGKELQRIRAERGILKSTMAKNLKVSTVAITAYEIGAKPMSHDMLKRLIRRYALSFERQIDLLYAYKVSEDQEDISKETVAIRMRVDAVDNAILKLLNKARGVDPEDLMPYVKTVEELLYGKLESQAHYLELFDTRVTKKIYEFLKNEYGIKLTVDEKDREKKQI